MTNAGWLAVCLGTGLTGLCGAAPPRSNVVFIYSDDQAAWTVGAYGNPEAHTPNLDRLATQGARLTNALVATPVCSPARAALFTSRYGSEIGIYDFITDPRHSAYTRETGAIGLADKFSTFPEALARAGYVNGLVGKWHLGDWTEDPSGRFHPTRHGFHYFMGLTGGGAAPNDAPLEKEGAVVVRPGLIDDVLTREGIGFIERNRDRSFLLFLALRAPHRRWLPVAPEDEKPFEHLEPTIPNPSYPDLDVPRVKSMMREYLAAVAGVDRHVGEVLAALDRLKLAENTIVIFSSDHGYNLGHNGIWHKGNGLWVTQKIPPDSENLTGRYRPNVYDHSLRVPAIVRWPGRIQPGTVIHETCSSLDWYPTLLAMAGAAPPPGATIRGRSLLPLLRGERVASWDNDFYAEYSMRVYCRTDIRAYRTPEWKLVRDFLNPRLDELYDLKSDPAETRNLIADARPEVHAVVARLDAKIREKMRQNSDPVLARMAAPR